MWVQKQQQARPQVAAAAQDASATSRLSLYDTPPAEVVAIEDFEAFAIDRLKVLKAIENDKAKGFKFPQLQERAKQLIAKHLTGARPADSQRKDLVSHFVLRLAYCRTDELRRWFLAQESDLFRYRFTLEPPSAQAAFLARHSLPFEAATPAELEAVKPQLAQVLHSLNQKEAAAEMLRGDAADAFYKVPWEQVPDLVATRRVLLRGGEAWVHKREMGSLVVSHFRRQLARALGLTARRWAAHLAAEEEDRLAPVVESLSHRYLGPDFCKEENMPKEAVSAGQIASLARQSFPLCMQHMYDRLHEEHHLRHGARQQLGLFLKGIGLPLEEALRFWRAEFAPRTPGDAFDKQHAYNVRFNYGREGKRTDYTPYSCLKIVGSAPGAADHHGCPYRTFSAEQLTAALGKMRIHGRQAADTVAKAAAGHYQLACAMAWEGVHGCACDTGINHPNQYFLESRKVLAEKGEAAAPTGGVPQIAEPRPTA